MSGVTVDYGICPVCGFLMLPVLEYSPCGHAALPEVEPLAEEGIVYSWTRVGVGREWLMAMVDFFDGSLRVTAPVRAEAVAIGNRVRLVSGEDSPYVFELVQKVLIAEVG